jgi:hypothetical protein
MDPIMPRPQHLDAEQLAKWEAELTQTEENPPPGMELIYKNPLVRGKIHEIGLVGMWLKSELQTAGVDQEKIDKFIYAFGQKCFMAPDIWDLAVKTLDLFKKTQNMNPLFAHITRDLPEEERQAIFQKYTHVHKE